jgi:hypothetical protein
MKMHQIMSVAMKKQRMKKRKTDRSFLTCRIVQEKDILIFMQNFWKKMRNLEGLFLLRCNG